LEDKQENL